MDGFLHFVFELLDSFHVKVVLLNGMRLSLFGLSDRLFCTFGLSNDAGFLMHSCIGTWINYLYRVDAFAVIQRVTEFNFVVYFPIARLNVLLRDWNLFGFLDYRGISGSWLYYFWRILLNDYWTIHFRLFLHLHNLRFLYCKCLISYWIVFIVLSQHVANWRLSAHTLLDLIRYHFLRFIHTWLNIVSFNIILLVFNLPERLMINTFLRFGLFYRILYVFFLILFSFWLFHCFCSFNNPIQKCLKLITQFILNVF